jgi:hypothetical protein
MFRGRDWRPFLSDGQTNIRLGRAIGTATREALTVKSYGKNCGGDNFSIISGISISMQSNLSRYNLEVQMVQN